MTEFSLSETEYFWLCCCTSSFPALETLRQVDHNFYVNLGYIWRFYLKTQWSYSLAPIES